MQYISVVCNELGEVVVKCSDFSNEQIQQILGEHEEYYIKCIEV